MTTTPCLRIKASARRHGLFLSLLGLLMLLSFAWLSNEFWQQAKFVLMFLVLTSLVTLFIGLLKLAEPKYSIVLSPNGFEFHHRYGHWHLRWQDIRHIHPVTNTSGLERQQLNYIGIRLHDLTTLIDNISPRLANRLIHEQAPLIRYCIRYQLLTLAQSQLNFEPYLLAGNQQIKGPLAAFLHHCEKLEHALGAHLFINSTNLNSSLADFATLANQLKVATKKADNHYQP